MARIIKTEMLSTYYHRMVAYKSTEELISFGRKIVSFIPEDALGYKVIATEIKCEAPSSIKLLKSCLKRAITVSPFNCRLMGELANKLFATNHENLARIIYSHIISINPSEVSAISNYAGMESYCDNIERSLYLYMMARQIAPNTPELLNNIALTMLRADMYETGWKRFHRRESSRVFEAICLQNKCNRATSKKKTNEIWVWPEQGIGDQILYARFLNNIKNEYDKINVVCDGRLALLFNRSFPFISTHEMNPSLSLSRSSDNCLYGDLPYIAGAKKETLDLFKEYLRADPVAVEKYKNKYKNKKSMLIGISWKSGRDNISQNKSISLSDFKGLLINRKNRLISLQYGQISEECLFFSDEISSGQVIIPEIDCKENLDELAAIIRSCDFVVTTSNTTAHIAGALGVNTFLILWHGPGYLWYWSSMTGGRSTWYRSITPIIIRSKREALSVISEIEHIK